MKKLLTNKQMRAADSRAAADGLSGETLMRRAGKAIADEAESYAAAIPNAKILVVCGTGNNGGDGYVCARLLSARGFNVSVYAFDGKLSPDCKREKERYAGAYTNRVIGDVIIDCIFGTGLCRDVAEPFAGIIKKINASGAYVISADIPSGLNGDNGLICGAAVKADLTVAVAQLKQGYFLNDGLDLCGKIELKNIGIVAQEHSAVLCEGEDIKKCYPARRRNSHKGTYGSCGIYAGQCFGGAAALAISAAQVSGCGYVKLTTLEAVKNAFVAAYPYAIYLSETDLTCNAIAFGMGSGKSEETYGQLTNILNNYGGKLIIDADGLNSLAEYGVDVLLNKKCEVLLTPHVKEFSRLSGLSVAEICANPVETVKNFAKKYGVCVLLKGASAVISDGETVTVCARGNSALARGGSGDMLSGYICGGAARGLSLKDAAISAHYVLGAAAELASKNLTEYCVTYNDILSRIPEVVSDLQ